MYQHKNLARLSAFTKQVGGGNPAGVWVSDTLPQPEFMQDLAAKVGYSETAFIAPMHGFEKTVRYYSPQAEVSFCGHATIATGVFLGNTQGPGTYLLNTAVGEVKLEVTKQGSDIQATLTSVPTQQRDLNKALLHLILQTINWQEDELDFSIPPKLAYAGAWHAVLAVKSVSRLNQLDYDFDALKNLMLDHELTTLQLIYRKDAQRFHSRNPFPVGGVVEDPATGAAAAALGGYLRDANLIAPPFDFSIQQGEAMGRLSELFVHIPKEGGIQVSGSAVEITTKD